MTTHETTTHDTIRGFFLGRVPEDWFTSEPSIAVDRDEILITGTIDPPSVPDDAGDEVRAAAVRSRIDDFRQRTRDRRVTVAKTAQAKFDRTVSWAVVCDDMVQPFTTLAAPAMTRLRMDERRVLDTLIDAGVARSRSEALAWCVRLVGDHTADWLEELREALEQVEAVRKRRPA